MKEKYFIALDTMSIDELEIWRLLYRYSDYETGITGYTINQLVIGADKRLNLTTQKVRTILKKFEKQGYIKFLTSGSKGKESTLLITLKQQLFNNNVTNKPKQNKQVKASTQQQTNNTTKNNNIYSIVIDYLNTKANTNYRHTTKGTQSLINARLNEGYTVEDFKKVIDTKVDNWSNTEWEKYLRPTTLFGSKFENYLNENKKAPMTVGTQNKNNFNSSICQTKGSNTEKIKFVNNF